MPSELETALSRLKGVKKISDGYMAICPCHDDEKQSLSLSEKNGVFLMFCHTGNASCSFANLVKALDLHPDTEKVTSVTSVITDTYDYISIEGLPYQEVRYLPKAFKQRRPDGQGGWLWDLNGITPSLYLLPELLKAIQEGKQVFIVEGAKDVNNLRKVGQVATTISGGASTKWHPSLVPLFQGARVVIIPDNDEPGRKYSLYVANLLYGWCASLKVIQLPLLIGNILPVKDVSDFLNLPAYSVDNLLKIVDNTKEFVSNLPEWFKDWRGVNQYLWQQLLKQKVYDKQVKPADPF